MKLKITPNSIDGIKWKHILTENTFGEEMCVKVDRWFNLYKDLGKDKVWKNSEGKKIPSYSAIVFFPKTKRWNDVIEELWETSPDMRELYGNSRDYLVVLELTVVSPNYTYKWHCDSDRKAFTGVVYWGDEGDGTVLRSGNNARKVQWKHNRGLWFANHHPRMATNDPLRPWHMYENKTNKPRYTVNINYTPQSYVKFFTMNKCNQLDYYLKFNEPKWLPMSIDG
jgi:hypothetical protein